MKKPLEYVIVEQILEDLKDRSGLKHEWEQIDSDIQQEIIDEWAEIIGRYL